MNGIQRIDNSEVGWMSWLLERGGKGREGVREMKAGGRGRERRQWEGRRGDLAGGKREIEREGSEREEHSFSKHQVASN